MVRLLAGLGDTGIMFFLIFLSEDMIVRRFLCRFHTVWIEDETSER
jgi:hypothetical protein